MEEGRKATTPPDSHSLAPTSTTPLIVTHAYFRGPLPPPTLLEHYERVCPGAADRILKLTETQAHVRHGLEEATVLGAVRSEARGQWLAFVVVLAGMGLGAHLVGGGHDLSGLVSMLTPLGIVAASFLYTRHAQLREREYKRFELERARAGQPG